MCATSEPPSGRLSTPLWCGQGSCAHGELPQPDVDRRFECQALALRSRNFNRLRPKLAFAHLNCRSIRRGTVSDYANIPLLPVRSPSNTRRESVFVHSRFAVEMKVFAQRTWLFPFFHFLSLNRDACLSRRFFRSPLSRSCRPVSPVHGLPPPEPAFEALFLRARAFR